MADRPSAPQPVALNINDIVRVRLTDSGRAALARQHVEFWAMAGIAEPYPHTPPKEDADGWSEWQLWSLMQDLGHLCRMGFELPLETTIQLPQAALDAAVAAARAEERERCAVSAWNHYMDTCRRTGRAFTIWHEWCASDTLRAATPQEPTK